MTGMMERRKVQWLDSNLGRAVGCRGWGVVGHSSVSIPVSAGGSPGAPRITVSPRSSSDVHRRPDAVTAVASGPSHTDTYSLASGGQIRRKMQLR